MEFQISAKRQLLGHYLLSDIFLLWRVLDGSDRDDADQLVWLSFVVRLVRLADCLLSRGAVQLTPAWDRTHNSENPGAEPHNVSTPPTFLCREEKGKAQRGEKREWESHKWETDPRPYLVAVPYWEGGNHATGLALFSHGPRPRPARHSDVRNQSKFFFLLWNERDLQQLMPVI